MGQLKERDVFAFRKARTRKGTKPSTINRDLRTIRAMLKRARPHFRFPAGAFFPEDETRVRWLRPDEEITVLESSGVAGGRVAARSGSRRDQRCWRGDPFRSQSMIAEGSGAGRGS